MKYQDIEFRTKRTQATEDKGQDNGEIGKEPDTTNPEDLPEYIYLFTHLFNKKKFKKLLKQREWDHEINLMEEAPKELNAKVYVITVKEEALNQWLDKQLKAGLIVESKSRYAAPCLYSKEGWFIMAGSRLQEIKSSHQKRQDTTSLEWRSNQQIEKSVTNFIQLVSPQLVNQFSQDKLCWKAPNKGYLYIYRIYKSDNKQLRYQAISNCKSFIC